jgi:hypothetical protein
MGNSGASIHEISYVCVFLNFNYAIAKDFHD